MGLPPRRLRRRFVLVLRRLDRVMAALPESYRLPFSQPELDGLIEVLIGQQTETGLVICLDARGLGVLENAVGRLEQSVRERVQHPGGH